MQREHAHYKYLLAVYSSSLAKRGCGCHVWFECKTGPLTLMHSPSFFSVSPSIHIEDRIRINQWFI
jgi:hypothetical protein